MRKFLFILAALFAGLSLTVGTRAADTIAVNNAAIQYGKSPYNWYTNGSTSMLTINGGAYLKFRFSGTSVGITFDVSAMSGLGYSAEWYPCIKWSVDGGAFSSIRQLVSSDTTITLASGLSDTTHSLEFIVTQLDDSITNRWDGIMSVKITGVVVDTGKTLSNATLLTGGIGLSFGDSITEGAVALAAYTTSYPVVGDASIGYQALIAANLNCEYGNVAFSGQQWINGNGQSVPGLATSYASILNGIARGWLPVPNYVTVNMGTNGGLVASSTLVTFLENLRAAIGPSPGILVIIPFAGVSVTNFTNGYNDYMTAHPGDRCTLFNGGSTCTTIVTNNSFDGTHPNTAGHVLLAAQVQPSITLGFAATFTTLNVTTLNVGP